MSIWVICGLTFFIKEIKNQDYGPGKIFIKQDIAAVSEYVKTVDSYIQHESMEDKTTL